MSKRRSSCFLSVVFLMLSSSVVPFSKLLIFKNERGVLCDVERIISRHCRDVKNSCSRVCVERTRGRASKRDSIVRPPIRITIKNLPFLFFDADNKANRPSSSDQRFFIREPPIRPQDRPSNRHYYKDDNHDDDEDLVFALPSAWPCRRC